MEARLNTEAPNGPPGPMNMTPDQLRGHMRGMWGKVAAAWGEHAAYVDARVTVVTEAMLAAADPRPGERVLELACGPGGLGLAAAERVGPGGEVVLSDIAEEMVEIAAARAQALKTRNVTARVLDLQDINEPDDAYDVVLCREGLMFTLDPAGALQEITRVLRPGGRVAIAVWGPRARNPWLACVFDAVSAQLGRPMPPPGVPGPFSLDDRTTLTQMLEAARLSDVIVQDQAVEMRAPSFETWWTRTSALAGPLANILGGLPEATRAELEVRLRETVRPFATSQGLAFPGVTLIASARRA